ncbi:MAG: hypothetical protein ACMUJM_10385 [bacterium]
MKKVIITWTDKGKKLKDSGMGYIDYCPDLDQFITKDESNECRASVPEKYMARFERQYSRAEKAGIVTIQIISVMSYSKEELFELYGLTDEDIRLLNDISEPCVDCEYSKEKGIRFFDPYNSLSISKSGRIFANGAGWSLWSTD